MDILSEIIEASDQMISSLSESGFFEETPFIEIKPFRRALQVAMQRKWEQENEMYLTDKEFLDICKVAHEQGISKTIEELVDKGAINMSISEDGEILYSANKEFNPDDL
jgi:uncharacterized protein YihD (DUF1040 family)